MNVRLSGSAYAIDDKTEKRWEWWEDPSYMKPQPEHQAPEVPATATGAAVPIAIAVATAAALAIFS